MLNDKFKVGTTMGIVDDIKAGKEVSINDYQTAIYLPKSDTVIIDCVLGCCYHTMTLIEFEEEYEIK